MIITLVYRVNIFFGTSWLIVPAAKISLEHLPFAELAKHFIHRLSLIFGGKEVFMNTSVALLEIFV
tara:strand:- start:162 stop:359 length:198 start_codon:yes stop_codon:yes gene_type:complete